MGRTAWRWALVPWSDRALVAVLVLATAVPSVLVSAASILERIADDELAVDIVADSMDDLGPTVTSEVRFEAAGLRAVDGLLTGAFTSVDGVGAPVRTTFTFPTLGVVDERRLGSPVRLVGRAGAADDITVVAGDATIGAAISTWTAEEFGVGIGDTIAVEPSSTGDSTVNDIVPGGGRPATFGVTAIYEPLWSADVDTVPERWQDVPELVPRHLSPFDAPGFVLVVVPESQLWDSGASGVVQWVAPLDTPTTAPGLHRVATGYAAIEATLVEDTALASAFDRVARPVAGAPVLESDLVDVVQDLDRARALVATPLRTSLHVGLLVALGLLVAAGVAHEHRRRRDVRLLAAEGRRWPGLAGVCALQVAGPGIVGTGIGVAAGVVAAGELGSAGPTRWADVPSGTTAVVGISAVAIISLVSGIRGQGALEGRPPLPRWVPTAAAAGGAVATAVLWAQVGQRARPGDIVTAFAPVAIVSFAVACGGAVLALVVRVAGPPKGSAGMVSLLVRQRLRTSPPNIPIAVLGLGLGLLLFTTGSAGAIDGAVATRAATAVGAETRLDLFGPRPDVALPSDMSLLRVLDTRVSPGGGRIRVVAVDPATFASNVAWPSAFGRSADEVVELLVSSDDTAVAAVAIRDEGLPTTGAFGGRREHRYTIVGEVSSLPLARSFGPTLLVSAPAVDEAARARAVANGEDPDLLPVATNRFRAHVLSTLSPADAAADLDAAGFGVREITTLRSRTSTPTIVAVRYALQYQRLLGLVMAVAAPVGMAMLLTVRRRRRHTAMVMLRSMGMRISDLAKVTAIEVVAGGVVAASAAAIGARLASGRLLDSLDPSPQALPPPTPSGALLVPILVIAGAATLCGVAAWIADMALATRTTTLGRDAD